jgi:predicted phage-related endonuclease
MTAKVVVAVAVDSTTTKATKVVVEQVKQLTEIRAEISRLEKQKEAITAEIEKAFGVDKKAKTSKFTTLTHNAIEFARLDWRSRKGIDTEKLAEKFPEAFEACQKPTIYSVVVSLFK